MKLSDYVVQFLFDRGVRTIFGYPGGSVSHLIDSLHTVEGMAYVQNYHEQASAFCADAYARTTGSFGVALATSGPGATNLVTGIANSYFDSTPCIFITGQVSTRAMKSRQEVRQRGFQETDIVSIVKPITKFAETLLEPNRIGVILEKAIYCATSGRPGAVLLDIPHDLQAAEIDRSQLDTYVRPEVKFKVPFACIAKVCDLLRQSSRPVLLAGGGVANNHSRALLQSLAHVCDLPVVASLRGLDAIPHDSPHFCGFIGSYGSHHANFAVANSDLLIAIGSRLDERQTGNDRTAFAKHARIIHVDIDPSELNHNIDCEVSINRDAGRFMAAIVEQFEDSPLTHKIWRQCIQQWARDYPLPHSAVPLGYLNPAEFLTELGNLLDSDALITVDVGQNQMWCAQSLRLNGRRRLLSSSGHGAMGYSLPAGIGAHYAAKEKQIVCIVGDGGLQMNIQELQTVARENIPLKIFLLNNNALGMIREYQENCFSNRCYGSVIGYANPDFHGLARAYKIPYTLATGMDSLTEVAMALRARGPHFVEVRVPQTLGVYPRPAPPPPVEDQMPLLDRAEFRRNPQTALDLTADEDV